MTEMSEQNWRDRYIDTVIADARRLPANKKEVVILDRLIALVEELRPKAETKASVAETLADGVYTYSMSAEDSSGSDVSYPGEEPVIDPAILCPKCGNPRTRRKDDHLQCLPCNSKKIKDGWANRKATVQTAPEPEPTPKNDHNRNGNGAFQHGNTPPAGKQANGVHVERPKQRIALSDRMRSAGADLATHLANGRPNTDSIRKALMENYGLNSAQIDVVVTEVTEAMAPHPPPLNGYKGVPSGEDGYDIAVLERMQKATEHAKEMIGKRGDISMEFRVNMGDLYNLNDAQVDAVVQEAMEACPETAQTISQTLRRLRDAQFAVVK